MFRGVIALVALLAGLPTVGWCAQTNSDEFSWGNDIASTSSADSLASFTGNCASGNCGGQGNCGQTSCGDPPCSGPLYQRKYISAFGGMADIDNFERSITDSTKKYIDGLNLHDGFAGGMAIGGLMIEHVRSEFEVTYRDNDFAAFSHQEFNLSTGLLTASNHRPATGNVRTYSGMFNLLFDTCPRCPYSPSLYLGGGLGGLYADGKAVTSLDTFVVQNSSFAYQFIAGINYPIRKRVDLYSEYRFLGANNLHVSTASTDYGDFKYDSHNIFFGIRLWK